MKNVNYNLLKVLHGKLDNVWRIEKHYVRDATKGCKKCQTILKKIWSDDQKHIAALRTELATHVKKDKLG